MSVSFNSCMSKYAHSPCSTVISYIPFVGLFSADACIEQLQTEILSLKNTVSTPLESAQRMMRSLKPMVAHTKALAYNLLMCSASMLMYSALVISGIALGVFASTPFVCCLSVIAGVALGTALETAFISVKALVVAKQHQTDLTLLQRTLAL